MVKYELSAHWNPRSQAVEFFGLADNEHTIISVNMKQKENRFANLEPFLRFSEPKELQILFDDLWRIGLRPTQKADGYKAELEATKYHLEDMRKIVLERK